MTDFTPSKKKKALEQFVREKTSAMKQRNRFATAWINNEQLYNGQSTTTLITRSNLHVPKLFEAVNTASARMGRMPEVDYDIKDEVDENAADIMKHLWQYDIRRSSLDEIFRLSKIECGLYSRGIIKLIPGNDGNKFELVDTMSFLISPLANSIKTARNCGQQFIYKTIVELEEEMEDMGYEESVIKKMKQEQAARGTLIASSYNEDQSLRNLRMAYLGLKDTSQLGIDVVEITEWYTYMGKEAVVMTVADDKYLLRIETLKSVGLPKFPYVSYATYPRGVAFWVPSVADIHRDPNLCTDVVVNQMIDNNTYRNFGMMFVDSSSGLKQSSISPRPLGITPINTGGGKIRDKVWQYVPPEISQAVSVMTIVNSIAENASGLSNVPAGKKGKSSVTEIATNHAVVQEKSNEFKMGINSCFEDLAQLYADTTKLNLTIPRKVKIYGREQFTINGVTKKNFEGIDFISKVTSAENADEMKALQQKAAVELFQELKDDPLVTGQKFLRENLMKKFGLTEDEIGRLFQQPSPQDGQQGLPQGQEGLPQPPQGSPQAGMPTGNPMNPAGAQLSATGSIAQSNTIK